MMLFAGVLAGVGQFILQNYVDPGYYTSVIETTLKESGFKEEDISLTMETGVMRNPIVMALSGAISMLLYGGMIGLVVSAFVKRPPGSSPHPSRNRTRPIQILVIPLPMATTNPDISVVVPLYNEQESLPELLAWIRRLMEANSYSFEVIFIDDGAVTIRGTSSVRCGATIRTSGESVSAAITANRPRSIADSKPHGGTWSSRWTQTCRTRPTKFRSSTA